MIQSFRAFPRDLFICRLVFTTRLDMKVLILCFSFTYDLDLNIRLPNWLIPFNALALIDFIYMLLQKCHNLSRKLKIISMFAFMNLATSNIFVPIVDTADFRRTNGDKLEPPTISPQRLRRNRLSKLRDDSKQLSPIFTVLSFSYKFKHVSKYFSEQHEEDIQNKRVRL